MTDFVTRTIPFKKNRALVSAKVLKQFITVISANDQMFPYYQAAILPSMYPYPKIYIT